MVAIMLRLYGKLSSFRSFKAVFDCLIKGLKLLLLFVFNQPFSKS